MKTVGLQSWSSGNGGERLRLLSYNVHLGIAASKYRHYLLHGWKHFLPFRHRLKNLNNIAHIIRSFDVVGLQELDSGSHRGGYVNFAQYLAEQADFPHWYDQTNRHWGRIAQHSMGILSRYPCTSLSRYALPSRVPGRGALMAHLGTREDPLVLLLVHLSLSAKARMRQVEFLSMLIRGFPHVIVMGDLNCSAGSEEMNLLVHENELKMPAADMLTYPSWSPRMHFDHILVSRSIHIAQAMVLPYRQSDHLPVAVEVVLPEGVCHGMRDPWPVCRVA
ncbi:MAG: endonuclease/exonuclease/phosphatase family protein [Desulfomonilia bacterium]|nr:endonuclease/exonuclease/phosphatase family protein [Desulfomonilia bacterium]